MSTEDIDKQLALNQECHVKEISVKQNASQHLKDVCQQLSAEYYKYLNIFDCFQASKLLPHCLYDYKIELTGDTTPPHS